MILLLLLLFLVPQYCAGLNVSSWWVGDINNPTFPIEKLNWGAYTHIHYGGPLYKKDGKTYWKILVSNRCLHPTDCRLQFAH